MVLLNVIWPTFALVTLIFVVWATLVTQRMRHLKRTPPARGDFASNASMNAYFEPASAASDNLRNLFEMPVLYFALVPLMLITQHANPVQVVLAWVFVGFRAAHSVIHIGPKAVQARFIVYLLSVVVLSAMWIGFFIDMVGAAHAYTVAMDAAAAARP